MLGLEGKGLVQTLVPSPLHCPLTTNIVVTVEGKVVVGRVDSAVELACTGLTHKATGPEAEQPSLEPQWGRRHGRWGGGAAFAHPRAADARVHRIFFNHI